VERVHRLDLGQSEISPRRTTPNGGLIVHATIARTGVQLYKNPDGTTRRELRLPEEVFSEDTLRSFEAAVVTVDHPGKLVTTDDWKRVASGHVVGTVMRSDDDPEKVATDLAIQDGFAVKGAESKKLTEVSCGYTCRLEPTSGTHPKYGAFDAIQRDIRGNHIAIGPKGWARGGPELRLHLDGGACVSGFDESDSYVPDEMTTATQQTPGPGNATQTPAAPTARSDADANEIATLRGQNAALTAEAERLRKADKERTDNATAQATQAEIDQRADARAELVADARTVLGGDWSPKGKTDDAIRREVLAKLEPELPIPEPKDDGAGPFVAAAYALALQHATKSTPQTGDAERKRADARQVRRGLPTLANVKGATARKDAGKKKAPADDDEEEEDPSIEDAREACVQRQRDRWKDSKMGKGGK
jgi:hypothetical protein